MSEIDLDAQLARAVRDPRLLDAAEALRAEDLPTAESILRPYLKERPTDVAAIRMMAELAARIGRLVDSEHLLRRALDLAPTFAAARSNLATVLYKQQRPKEAIEELNRLTTMGEGQAGHDSLKAAAAGRLGAHDEAIDLYTRVLEERPRNPALWVSLGHNFRTVGRVNDAIDAYRRATSIVPQFGEAWWSLANLKTFRFTDDDLDAMSSALSTPALRPEDRVQLNFAIGKALEDRENWEASFTHYAAANKERRDHLRYRASDYRQLVDRSIALFDRNFFDARAGFGSQSPDPIFIVGLPRAGSTLVEQILSSHPLVEGTTEHPDIPLLAKRLSCPDGVRETESYPELLSGLDAKAVRALGEEYLERVSVQRVTGKPYFIDKLPNNWIHLGLIRLILPHARIVDARRHPLACGFSNFKQHFARGQNYTYDLAEMGDYYVQYVRMMRHMAEALPLPPVRIINEELVADPEGQIRLLVEALGLPWDDACLNHHENRRAVRTPSAEQVRQPINAAGVDQWRHFAPWLGPLETALGDTVADWAL